MIQRGPAPIRTKSTSSLPTSNCWRHQSSLPHGLVRDQTSSAPDAISPRYDTQPLVLIEQAEDEDERGRGGERGIHRLMQMQREGRAKKKNRLWQRQF